jgi:hypothetical protein
VADVPSGLSLTPPQETKKIVKTSDNVGQCFSTAGPSSYKKRIYLPAVSQRLKTTDVGQQQPTGTRICTFKTVPASGIVSGKALTKSQVATLEIHGGRSGAGTYVAPSLFCFPLLTTIPYWSYGV